MRCAGRSSSSVTWLSARSPRPATGLDVTAGVRREILGFNVGDSEDGAFWTAFLRSLKARGLGGVALVIADAHLGLGQVVQAVLAGAAVARCRVHFLPNVLARVPKGSAEPASDRSRRVRSGTGLYRRAGFSQPADPAEMSSPCSACRVHPPGACPPKSPARVSSGTTAR